MQPPWFYRAYYLTTKSKGNRIISMKSSFLSTLSKNLFWDCNVAMLDPDVDRNLVLERVFSRGTENDERAAFKYYGKEQIRDTVVNIKSLDKKALNYLSIVFNIPKQEFRCYKSSLSKNPFGIS